MDFTEPYRTDPVCFMYKKPPPAPQVNIFLNRDKSSY